MMEVIGPEAEAHLSWDGLVQALIAGHRLPRAEIGDTLLYRGKDTLLNRAAWIDGLGQLVKTATIFPGNAAQGVPTVNGGVCLYADRTGVLEAVVDFHLVTKWKTAGDSLLSARQLARPDSRNILIVGAGAVARSMVEVYRSAFPQAAFTIWNRSVEKARALADEVGGSVVAGLEGAVRAADIIATCTMSHEPLIQGAWLSPGTHLDLIGAYRPDMREVDDEALLRARIFVDSRATTVGHIGELMDPIARGVISESDVVADFYDLARETYDRRGPDEITIAKNGGGAHLDLMTAAYILQAWRGRPAA
jgi:ornithine cyclodeaminase